jgi:transketolase
MDDIDLPAINTIRTLSIDAVQKAKSGHPGTPMGLAPVVYTLWRDYLRYDPSTPLWPNRDRFDLSPRHASMLLYSLLHLARVEAVDADGKPLGRKAVSIDDIKVFRQIDSQTLGPDASDSDERSGAWFTKICRLSRLSVRLTT